MNSFLRVMFWVLSVVTCAIVIFCAYHVERPLAIEWPLDSIAIWGAVAALAFTIGLFLSMPQTRNGRIGLVLGLFILAFTCYSSFETLNRTKFLYHMVDLSVNLESASGEATKLGGVLVEPVNRFELPVVLLMPDASTDSYKRNLYYAKALARRGVAAVAYGRSGGAAVGPLAAADLETRGADVLYVLDLLEKRTELDMSRAGIAGFSENEWVIPFTAQKTNRVDFAILLAPSGMLPVERILANLDQELRSENIGPDDIASAKALVTDLAESLRTGDSSEKRTVLIQRWDAAKNTAWFKAAGFPSDVPQAGNLSAATTSLSFDAAALWSQVTIPVLILAGSNDPLSLPETLRDRFTQYFEKDRKSEWKLQILPNANHRMLMGADSYGSLDAEFPAGLFDSLATWIKDATKPAAPAGALR
ncbi:MAG: alpha/beta hydrolase [Bryobacterales bacterium]|nr:alpha/beta hydrolase [Bryobacterales bacterium]